MESHLNIVESANFMTYNGNHLFHYTSFSSALKIIVSGKLLFGEFKNMNEISEFHREVMDPTLEISVCYSMMSLHFTLRRIMRTT